jgi:guanine deaminase
MTHDAFMRRAIELSRRSLTEPGTEPFGAVVVKDGVIIGEGLNHAAAHYDPTSHGEIEAIRDACRKLKCADLSGCDIYTSCEPCALCVAAMEIVGIRRLFYAASLGQSARALADVPPEARPTVDAAYLREQAGLPVDERRTPSQQLLDSAAIAVLEAWAEEKCVGTEDRNHNSH